MIMISPIIRALAIVLALSSQAMSTCVNDPDFEWPSYIEDENPMSCTQIRIEPASREAMCPIPEVNVACPLTCGTCFEDEDVTYKFKLKTPKVSAVPQESATKMPKKTSAPQGTIKTPKLKRGKIPKGKTPKAKTPKAKAPKAKAPKAKAPKNPTNPEEPPQYTLTVTVRLNFTIGINTDQLTSQEAIDSTAQVIADGAQQFMPERSIFNVLSIGNNTVSSRRRLEISEVHVEGEVVIEILCVDDCIGETSNVQELTNGTTADLSQAVTNGDLIEAIIQEATQANNQTQGVFENASVNPESFTQGNPETNANTPAPTNVPSTSMVPSPNPTESPSKNPSASPSNKPSLIPSNNPSSESPTHQPSFSKPPSALPSLSPSQCLDEPDWKFDGEHGCDVITALVLASPSPANPNGTQFDMCEFISNIIYNDKTVNEACCICSGGRHQTTFPSLIPSGSPSVQPSKTPSDTPTTHPSDISSESPTDESSQIPISWQQMGGDINGEAEFDYSGRSVSLSSNGNTVAIGGTGHDEYGPYHGHNGHTKVYKWESSNSTWLQMGDDIDGEAGGDVSGFSVSLSSNGIIVAIGATYNDGNGKNSGHVRVYKWDSSNSNWLPMGGDINGETRCDLSGRSVSLSSNGKTVAIGATGNYRNGERSGHVRVYKWDSLNSNWLPMGGDLDGEAAYDLSGWSVSLSSNGTIVAIGAPFNDGNGDRSGHTRVYRWCSLNSNWLPMGGDLDGEAAGDLSGYSVSLSSNGTIVAIGAYGNDGNGNNSGHVRVYTWDSLNSNWLQMGGDLDGEAANDQSGYSVSLSSDGGTAAIGAYGNDESAYYSGHTRVYTWDSSNLTWLQMGDDIDGEATDDRSGYSVSLSSNGTIVAIGADFNDGNGDRSGHTRVYTWDSSNFTWLQMGDDINGEAIYDQSGGSVSLSSDGDTVAIGAHWNGGNGSSSGHVRVYSVRAV